MSGERRGWNRGWDVKSAAVGLFLIGAGLVLLRRDEAAFDALPALAVVGAVACAALARRPGPSRWRPRRPAEQGAHPPPRPQGRRRADLTGVRTPEAGAGQFGVPARRWASSNSSWTRTLSSAVWLRMAARRALAPSVWGASIGSPTTTTTFTGRIILAPLPMALSEPPMPTGTIGAPVRPWMNAGPSNSSSTTGPSWRVPSGNITSGSPPSTTAWQACSASRSAVPWATGMPPSADHSTPNPGFQRVSLARNRCRRRAQPAASMKSMFDRWTGARMKGRSAGTFSRPRYSTRSQTRAKATRAPRMKP